MKHFNNFKQLKYVIIFCAVLSLIVLEIIYVMILGHETIFVMIELLVGTTMIVVLAEVAFHFGTQLQTQLMQEVKDRKEVEEKLLLRSTALESAANAIAITDENGRFLSVNSAFIKLTGYSEEELIGQSHALLRSGKQSKEFYKHLWQTISAGQVWHGEIINRHKNGDLYTEDQIITPVLNGNGQVSNFIAIKHDISARKEAEGKLQEYTERLRLIHSIDQAILSKHAPDEIARVVLDYSFQMIPCNRASVVVLDEFDYEGTVIAVIQDGETAISPGHSFSMSEIEKRNLEDPETALPVKILKIQNPSTLSGKQIRSEGIRAHIKIPLIAREELIGFFNLGALEEDAFTEEHITVAQEIATSLAIALQQSRLYQMERHQREQAEALREIGEALNSTLDFDEILKLLLGQILRAIRYDTAHIILIDEDIATIRYIQGYEHYGQDTVEKVANLAFSIPETPNLNWIVEHQEPLIIPDVHAYEGWLKDKGVSQTRSWVGVPIFVDGEISVIIALSRRQPNYYRDNHVDTLRAFASQVGLALENARLYEEQRAYTNKLEERVRARTRALANANERLKELDRLKTKFISDVSHELRTPITNVTMYLDLLERGHPDKYDHYMTVLKQETYRLSQLIENIFDETQYTSHLRQAEYDVINLHEIIIRSIKFYQQEATRAGLLLTHDLEPDLPLILGEPLQLGRVFSNLLKNAISYTLDGEICITTRHKEDVVMISVVDTGVGIVAEDLPHLFDRFYRGKNASQSTIPGTGLGLGVVREIIELHGGSVQAFNNANGGATIEILLPANQMIDHTSFLRESRDLTNESVSAA